MHLVPLGWCILILAAGALSGIAGQKRVAATERPRLVLYAARAVGLLIPAAITAALAYAFARDALRSLAGNISPRVLVSWFVGLTVVCIAVTTAFLESSARRGQALSQIARRALPLTLPEYWTFGALCVVTGFREEFLYQGYALSVLAGAADSIWFAAVVVTVFFSLNHLVQNVAGAVRGFVFGLVLVPPVIITGSVWPSIIAHVLTNMFTGFFGRAIAQVRTPPREGIAG
jgi:membrane protease YdiL (CAAX protease family)